jgi:PAS domain S-box-containing protein
MMASTQHLSVNLNPANLDDIALGVIRISKEKRVSYANRSAREAAGPQLVPGAHLSDIFLDGENRARLEHALEKRFSSESGSDYSLVINRPDIGTTVRVMINAVPDYDADGNLIGSIGFVTNISRDTASLAIHDAIESADTWQNLLERVAAQMRQVIAFDSFAVSIVSENRHHLRQFFETPPAPQFASPIKWWPMPPFVQQMLQALEPCADSVDEMFSRPEYRELKEKDIAVQIWLQRGFKHMLRCPVYRQDRLAAIVMLYRYADQPFSAHDVETIRRLPTVEAVNMALALDRKAALQFSLDLIAELGEVADSIPDLAHHLVKRLQQNYQWEHVSLFQVDEDRRKLTMICQECLGAALLPEGYEQGIHEGFLGQVMKTGKAVNAGDVTSDAWRHIYLPGMTTTRSELCLPIPGSKLRWILNVEASVTDAFADEEQRSVELLLKQAGLILDRATSIELKNALLHWMDDAVIQTNKDGMIQEMNPAAERCFQSTLSVLKGKNIAKFLDPGDDAQQTHSALTATLVTAPKLPATEVTLVAANGTRLPMLISGTSLPAELGGKVYVARDLSLQRRVKTMDLLKQVFQQVASETRIPLALATTFLSDTTKAGANVADLVDKALKQLRKADLPLERVVRLAAATDEAELPSEIVDVRDLLRSIVDQLPVRESAQVKVLSAESAILAKVASRELSFCLQSILAFLLRQKAENDTVDIKLAHAPHQPHAPFISLGLIYTDSGKISKTVIDGDQSEHLREFGLAEPVIAGLMHKMQGHYYVDRQGVVRYRLVLQPAEENHVAIVGA